jgi:hypothetical protein
MGPTFIYADPESNVMGKRKTKTKEQQYKATLAEVVKEMAKPRVTRLQESRIPLFSERSSSRGERC